MPNNRSEFLTPDEVPNVPEYASEPIPGLQCFCGPETNPQDCPLCNIERNDMENEDEYLTGDELADSMKEWYALQLRVDELRKIIVKSTLMDGRTQKAGVVQAVYNEGSRSYNYRSAGLDASPEIIAKHTVPETNWRYVCESAGITKDKIPFDQGEPKVSLRVTKG